MLEIGLGCGMQSGVGGGVKLFNHIFSHPRNAILFEMHSLEFSSRCAREWVAANPGWMQLHMGDQNSPEDLERVFRDAGGLPFDLIVDDGSHIPEHQHTSLVTLYKHLVRGGIYVLEDIHSSCKNFRTMGPETSYAETSVGGTPGCMVTTGGGRTMLAAVFEWMKDLAMRRMPKGMDHLRHIDMSQEAVVFEKELD